MTIDLSALAPDQREALEAQYAAEKRLAQLRKESRERREAEERERKAEMEAQKEARRAAQEEKITAEIRRRFLATGATEAQWEAERGKLIAQYRADVALGRETSADDKARAAFAARYRNF